MTDPAMGPLRRRMIEDMTIRKFVPKTQHDYLQRVKNFAAYLGRSPDTANFEDLRPLPATLGCGRDYGRLRSDDGFGRSRDFDRAFEHIVSCANLGERDRLRSRLQPDGRRIDDLCRCKGVLPCSRGLAAHVEAPDLTFGARLHPSQLATNAGVDISLKIDPESENGQYRRLGPLKAIAHVERNRPVPPQPRTRAGEDGHLTFSIPMEPRCEASRALGGNGAEQRGGSGEPSALGAQGNAADALDVTRVDAIDIDFPSENLAMPALGHAVVKCSEAPGHHAFNLIVEGLHANLDRGQD